MKNSEDIPDNLGETSKQTGKHIYATAAIKYIFQSQRSDCQKPDSKLDDSRITRKLLIELDV